MRFLKQYAGVLLILITVVVLYLVFSVIDMDKATYNWTLVGCAVAIILGILLCICGGKSADKIGGK